MLMILPILTLISALSISATAAYFSIVGLATMFPGAQGAIILMGSVLEVGKIVAAIWLHTNWNKTSRLIRYYLLISVGVLMLITSMGIFGFLSKSYIVHEAESNKEIAKISQIENKITRENSLIERLESSIEELKQDKTSQDSTKVNFISLEESRITKLNEIAKSSISSEHEDIGRWRDRVTALDQRIQEMRSKGGIFSNKKKNTEEESEKQKEERLSIKTKISLAETNIQELKNRNRKDIENIQEKIETFQNSVIENTKNKSEEPEIRKQVNESLSKIENLEREKFDFQKRVSELEVEVGPVKYIVELFSDLGKKDLGLGSAVRIVIIALIFVFDPLAVLLVVISVGSFEKSPQKINKEQNKLKQIEKESEAKLNEMKKNSEEEINEMKQGLKQESEKLKQEILNQKLKQKEELKDIKEVIEKKNEATRGFMFGENRETNNTSNTNWKSEGP